MNRLKGLLAIAGVAALAAGCATDPYYDYGYGGVGYGPAYGYGYGYDYPGYYYGGPVVGSAVISGGGYYYRDRDGGWRDRDGRWRDRDNRTWQQRRDDAATPRGPGVEYNNEYERQNLENRERLLRGQQPSGAGG